MTESTLTHPSSYQSSFLTRFRALLWKEWREMRRPFIGSLVMLVVLPGLFGVAYLVLVRLVNEWGRLSDWREFKDVILASILSLSSWSSLPLAAGWGAYTVCRDLNSPSAAFLFSRSVSIRHVLLAKALMAWVLFSIFSSAILIVIILIVDLQDTGPLTEPAFWAMYYSGLIAGLFTSFAVAVFTKRLISSILMGLLGTIFYVIVPTIWSENAYEGIGKTQFLYKYSLFSIGLTCVLVYVSCRVGWRADRVPISNRKIAWTTVLLLLALVASISDSFATNTQVVGTVAPEGKLIGINGEDAYWYDTWPEDDSWAHAVVRASIDSNGNVIDRKTIRLVGFPEYSSKFLPDFQFRDFKNLLYVERKGHGPLADSIIHFVLDFDIPEAKGKPIAVPLNASLFDWIVVNGSLIHLDSNSLLPQEDAQGISEYLLGPSGRGRIYCFDPSDGTARLRSQTESIPMLSGRTDLVDGELRLTVVYIDGEQFFLRQYVVNASDPTSIHFSKSSEPLPLYDDSDKSRWQVMQTIALQGNKLAYVTPRGLGLFELHASGKWKELDWRYSGLLELLSGDRYSTLTWHGSRLYEISSFGLLIFDTSNPYNLRRVGHASEFYWPVAGIDERQFIGGQSPLRLHRIRN